jgi:hypothetical protein
MMMRVIMRRHEGKRATISGQGSGRWRRVKGKGNEG